MRDLISPMILCIAVLAGNVWALPVTDGLVLHLDADAITDVADGTGIDIWEDISGMGNNATQPVEANQPTYIASDPNFFARPVVSFNGAHFMEMPPTAIRVGSFTVFAVGRFNYTEGNQYIMNGQDGGGNDRIRFAWDNASADTIFEFRAGSTGWKDVTTPADTLIHVFGMTSDIEGFLDGVSIGTSENTSNENPTAFNIGSYNRGEKDFFDGELAEFVLYNRVLSHDEIVLMSEFLRPKSDFASKPYPPDGTIDVPRETILGWRPGEHYQNHQIFLGTDFNDVSQATASEPRGVLVSDLLSDAIFDPPGFLEFNQTYYWRADQINNAEPNSPWIGNVWDFTTANFVVVDDFEDYNDYKPDDIFSTWTDGYGSETNGALVGYDEPDFEAGEHFVETTIVHGGFQSMPYFYDKDLKFCEAVLPLEDLARDWIIGGVHELSLWFKGNPAYAGSFVEMPDGTFTMTGMGTDIYGASDQFHFAYKEITTGTVTITAKIENLDNTDPFAKAGVMVRDTLDPESCNAALLITPENGLRYQYRTTEGGDTDREFVENVNAPYWVQLQRTSGGLIRGHYSENGSDWTQFSLKSVTMQMPIYVGLAVSSHNIEAVCQSTFSNVEIDGTVSQDLWTDQDVGILSNSAQPMYITLNDNTPVYYSEPNDPNVISPDATQISNWTEWKIPLEKFTDQGINLTQVEIMTIGVGIKDDTTTLGGTGLLFFDDIRLNRP